MIPWIKKQHGALQKSHRREKMVKWGAREKQLGEREEGVFEAGRKMFGREDRQRSCYRGHRASLQQGFTPGGNLFRRGLLTCLWTFLVVTAGHGGTIGSRG